MSSMETSGTDQSAPGRAPHGGIMLTRPSGRAHYAALQFSDADSCVAWLENVPFSRLTEAHEMLTAQTGLLQTADLSPLDKLRILEVLYQAAGHLQERLADRFIGCALPLSIVEYSIWRSVVELWQILHDAYAACLRYTGSEEESLATHLPLLGLRCIELSGAAIREHHRVYHAVPAALWKQMHEAYACVDGRSLVHCGVADPLRDAMMPARTCASTYAAALLAHLGNPCTMSPRQMQVTYRWADQWASLVGVQVNPLVPAVTPVLAVDLRSGNPASAALHGDAGPSIRYIVLEQLGQTLRRVLTLLRQGHAPAALGLGDDVRQPGCERLLTLLYIQWCGSGMNPLPMQREHGEELRACVGFASIERQLAAEAEAFRAPGASPRTAYGPLTEHWNIVSINAPGFIGVARGPECEARIQHHQLVAIKRRSASGFQLAVVQWLKREEDGELSIGLRLLPGLPHPSPVRSTDDDGPEAPGIMLPAAPEMRVPATLVLPQGAFRPGKTVALTAGVERNARLLRLAERGADFERAVFELV